MATDETKAGDDAPPDPQTVREDARDGDAPGGPGQQLVRALRGRAVVRQIDIVKVRLGSSVKELQSAAAPAASQTTALVKRRTSEAAVYLKRFRQESAAPLLTRFRQWLGRRLHPKSLIRDYRKLLLAIHTAFTGRDREALFFVPTRGRVRRARLSIPSQVRSTAHDYRPTPYKVFAWAMRALPEESELRDTVFVDFGAGRGRVLMLASGFPFERITGAEIAQELHGDCQMNIAQYPRSFMKCRDVDCVHTRATTLPIPEQPAAFYFFNPFEMNVFEKVLSRITRSYKRSRRQMYLVCVGMREAKAVEASGIFQPVAMPLAHRAKIRSLSPYSIGVYKTEP